MGAGQSTVVSALACGRLSFSSHASPNPHDPRARSDPAEIPDLSTVYTFLSKKVCKAKIELRELGVFWTDTTHARQIISRKKILYTRAVIFSCSFFLLSFWSLVGATRSHLFTHVHTRTTPTLSTQSLAGFPEPVEAQARQRRRARGRREGGGEVCGRERYALLVIEAEEAAIGQRGA